MDKVKPNPDPAGFIQQQNTASESLLDEIIAVTGVNATSPAPSNILLEAVLDATGRKVKLHSKLEKARAALDVARAVRRAEKEAALATLAAEKAAARAAAADAKQAAKDAARAADKLKKHNSLVRCMRRGAKLLAFTTGWQGRAKKATAAREYRPKGCALMAAIVGRYGSVEAWRAAGSPYGPAECKKHWPDLTDREMSKIMSDNDTCRSTREQTAARLKAKGF